MKKLVPDWFTDNLHEIIYSDTTKSWLLVQGLEHTKELSSQDLRILRKHAQGRSNVEIAIRFHAKQSMVWKHISYMRQILGKRFMRDISYSRRGTPPRGMEKKTPRIAAWCRLVFRFNVFFNSSRREWLLAVYRAGGSKGRSPQVGIESYFAHA